MVFLEKTKKMAQKLQSRASLALLVVFFVFPVSGLFADVADLPVIIPSDELLTPIELRDGLVYQVVVEAKTEMATSESLHLENAPVVFSTSSLFINSDSQIEFPFSSGGVEFAAGVLNISQLKKSNFTFGVLVFDNGPEHFSVKSIASPGLFGFLGICLSRSELPSKNFSTPCENFQPKSMTRRFANDWKFLWQPVKTTSLWHMSTSSSKTQKTSIQRPSLSHTLSMSDISSIWSNAMAGSQAIFCQEKRKGLSIALAQSHLKSHQLQAVLNPNDPQLNPQFL